MKRILFLIVLLSCLFSSQPCSFGQSWDVWRTTPVFDGERVMPLSSFASQIVKEICGTSTPYLTVDDDVMDDLNRLIEEHAAAKAAAETALARKHFSETDSAQDSIFNYERKSLLDGIDDTGIGSTGEKSATMGAKLEVQRIDPDRIEHIRKRIQLLIPQGGRYFEPTELLLSWIGEPDVWDNIPIFAASEWNYREEVLGASYQNKRRYVLRRISVAQLMRSKAFQSRGRAIDQKRMELGNQFEPSPYDMITERIQRALELYQQLTFNPAKQQPTRMIDILHRTIDSSMGQITSFGNVQSAWRNLLTLGDEPSKDADEDGGAYKHPTTERWEEILHKIMLIGSAFERTDQYGKPRVPNLDAVQNQFEQLLQRLDENRRESEALMEAAYPTLKLRPETKKPASTSKSDDETDVSVTKSTDTPKTIFPGLFSGANSRNNSDAIRNLVLRYHYSVKRFSREIEAAYLALYDNGRSLRILPIVSDQTVDIIADRDETFVQPWGSVQTVLYGNDAMIRRFFDPQFDPGKGTSAIAIPREHTPPTTQESPESETEIAEQDSAEKDADRSQGTESTPKDEIERLFFTKTPPRSEAVSRTPLPSDSIGWVRVYFDKLVAAYGIVGNEINWSDGGRLFNEAVNGWSESLRAAGTKIDSERALSADPNNVAQQETLAKTNYPSYGATFAEYRYFRLGPFFWMWVFAACSVVVVAVSMLVGRVRRGMIDVMAAERGITISRPDFTGSAEEYIFGIGLTFLLLSVFVTFVGGLMRAAITGWAPVTNMYETVVLMAFCAALFGLWYGLRPMLHPIVSLAWRLTSFPSFAHHLRKRPAASTENTGLDAMRQAASDFGVPGAGHHVDPEDDPDAMERAMRERREGIWRSMTTIPRLLLMFLTFFGVVNMCYGEYAHDHGVFAAMFQMLTMHDPVDWIVVVASIVLIVWFVPHLLLAAAVSVFLLFRPAILAADAGIVSRHVVEVVTPEIRRRSELSGVFSGETNMGDVGTEIDDSGAVWLTEVRNQILDRKTYILVGAFVALLAGLAAYFNSTQFNPNIRPLVAVLRSNFWLTVHVIAIIVSYAAASVAWGMSAVALGDAIFGRYRRSVTENGRRLIHPPKLCDAFAKNIHRMIRFSVLMLALGTILGARWADYSWGRFWSWDPKEVWALITLLFFLIVLHGRIGRLYGPFGIVVGGLFGSIAVIMTWYGINFVMKAGMHSYGGSVADSAVWFLCSFIGLNLIWGAAAIGRYCTELYAAAEDY